MGNSSPRRPRSASGVGRRPSPLAPRSATAVVTAVITLALAACTGKRATPTPDEGTAAGASGAPARSARVSSAVTGDVCIGNGAHDRHAAAGFDCAVCHACAGVLSFGAVTFPGGASTEGGTITVAGGTTTCTVACHSPLGAEPHAVAWNSGPLQCTSCHTNVTTLDASAARSAHVIAGTSTSATCQGCHDQSQHMSGVVRLLNGDGTATSGSCVGCHSGQGQTLGDRTPPLLVGWSDAASGDSHGPATGDVPVRRARPRGAEIDQARERCRAPPGSPTCRAPSASPRAGGTSAGYPARGCGRATSRRSTRPGPRSRPS